MAFRANLGETCLCRVYGYVSLWECDLCQACSSWQEENNRAGHPRKLNPKECSSLMKSTLLCGGTRAREWGDRATMGNTSGSESKNVCQHVIFSEQSCDGSLIRATVSDVKATTTSQGQLLYIYKVYCFMKCWMISPVKPSYCLFTVSSQKCQHLVGCGMAHGRDCRYINKHTNLVFGIPLKALSYLEQQYKHPYKI